MSQFDFGTLDPNIKSGTALATDLNSWRNALHTGHKGAAAPGYAVAGLTWLDDTLDPLWLVKRYDGTSWIVIEAIDITNNLAWTPTVGERQRFPLAGGSANALTLTPAVALTAYTDLDVITFEASADNSGATTLNVSGVGAKAIRKIVAGADVALAAGDILDGSRYTANYDTAANAAAGAWILAVPPPASATAPGLVELATNAEAQGKSDAGRALTPSNLASLGASATFAGLVELATAAEVATGTDTARVPSVSTMGDHQGMAKAWVKFNGSGVVAINDSYGVTSISDNNVGDYTVNLASAMANANFAAVGMGGTDGSGNMRWLSVLSQTTTAINVISCGTTTQRLDSNNNTVAVFGD
ncbi:hypothetical protein GGQ99_004808 [Aminobacter niigataensis]|uniref:Uncharacterized protein n=1 Tax=Aminobacter niigataensis TaxID=83265 RepID=A0ABR6L9Y6_9HYPH|nr:hypothetical protein [Aminobacter niigataensis]MBB4653024.1 hypothetical protein [Aminobacter niigataensis]